MSVCTNICTAIICFLLIVALKGRKRNAWSHHIVRESRPETIVVKHVTKTGEFMCKMHVPTNYISFGSPCGSAQDHHKLLEILDGYSIGEQGLDFPTFPDLVADICANGPIRRYVESIIERTATDANNNSSRRRKRGISIHHLNSRCCY